LRHRIDKTLPFNRVPVDPCPAFPDRRETWLPLLFVSLTTTSGKEFNTNALLDTGAGITLFGTNWADALGIDWRSCPTIPFIGIGAKNIGHVAKLNLRLPSVQYTWTADVAFSEAMNSIKFPLLGHIGFFDRFTVTFRPRAFKLFLAADEDLR